MKPTIDQLSDGILRLGYDDDDRQPCSELAAAVWKKLQERGYVQRSAGKKPKLTAKGASTFTTMEAGDDVPEFTYNAEE